MPAVVQDWTRALMSILLSYRSVVGLGDLAAVLLQLSQGLGRLRAWLTDPASTRFVAVTRASALERAETVRLVAGLAALHIHVSAIIVNAVGRGEPRAMRRAAAAEAREIAKLRRLARAGARDLILGAHRAAAASRSRASLRRWIRRWA